MLELKQSTHEGLHQEGSPWPLALAANYLHCSQRHLARLIAARKVASIMLGRRRFIADAELKRIASEGVA